MDTVQHGKNVKGFISIKFESGMTWEQKESLISSLGVFQLSKNGNPESDLAYIDVLLEESEECLGVLSNMKGIVSAELMKAV